MPRLRFPRCSACPGVRRTTPLHPIAPLPAPLLPPLGRSLAATPPRCVGDKDDVDNEPVSSPDAAGLQGGDDGEPVSSPDAAGLQGGDGDEPVSSPDAAGLQGGDGDEPVSPYAAGLQEDEDDFQEYDDADDAFLQLSAKQQAFELTKRDFKAFVAGPVTNFARPLQGRSNYLTQYDSRTWEQVGEKDSNVPFKLNPFFKAEPVLSDEFQEEIYRRVAGRGMTVRSVSAQLGVSLERVAAVVRLKAVEEQWMREGKHIATYLTKTLQNMMPVTHLRRELNFHEQTQDLPAHPFAQAQTFVPVSESRQFTRADAGKVFGLPPTEETVPHPELVELAKEQVEGLNRQERVDRQMEREKQENTRAMEKKYKEQEKMEKGVMIVEKKRWLFRLKEAETGKVGHRYGVPHEDRKIGQVKIPAKVEW